MCMEGGGTLRGDTEPTDWICWVSGAEKWCLINEIETASLFSVPYSLHLSNELKIFFRLFAPNTVLLVGCCRNKKERVEACSCTEKLTSVEAMVESEMSQCHYICSWTCFGINTKFLGVFYCYLICIFCISEIPLWSHTLSWYSYCFSLS